MDAVDFIKELKRMHKKYFNPHYSTNHCGSCPLKSKECEKISLMDESTVQKVEEWSNANPRLKRRDILLRIWPNATPEKFLLVISLVNAMATGIVRNVEKTFGESM